MIKKLILSTTLLMSVAYGSTDKDSSTGSIVTINEKTKYAVWDPPMGENESGESCKDGKCMGNFSCIKKDGKVYKFFTSFRDKVKKQCKKL